MICWLTSPFRIPWLGWVCLGLVAVAVLAAGSHRSLLTPYDDAFFAYAAKQLATDGQWLDIKTRDGPLLEKPPLAIWIQSLAVRAFGVDSWTVRLPGLLVACVGLGIAYLILRRHFGPAPALLSCLILVTSQQFVQFARRPVTEIYLTVWVMLALLSYWDSLLRGRGYWWTGLFVTLAIMTKGIMGFMPYGIIISHLVITRSWRELRSRRLWLALGETLILVLPWHVIMIRRLGDAFLNHYFWEIQLSFITGTSHVDPWYWSTITRKILENYWPWLLALIPSLLASARMLWRTRHGSSEEDTVTRALASGRVGEEVECRWLVILWVWLAVIFVFFHLTDVKRHHYVLPAYPAMAFTGARGDLATTRNVA